MAPSLSRDGPPQRGHRPAAFTMAACSPIISDMPDDALALLDEVLPGGASGSRAAGRVRPLLRASVAQW